jgi:hypothetical protein
LDRAREREGGLEAEVVRLRSVCHHARDEAMLIDRRAVISRRKLQS